MCDQCRESQEREPSEDEGVKWLALLLRQSMKLFIAGVDAKYGESRSERERRKREATRQEQRAA